MKRWRLINIFFFFFANCYSQRRTCNTLPFLAAAWRAKKSVEFPGFFRYFTSRNATRTCNLALRLISRHLVSTYLVFSLAGVLFLSFARQQLGFLVGRDAEASSVARETERERTTGRESAVKVITNRGLCSLFPFPFGNWRVKNYGRRRNFACSANSAG